MTYRAVHNPNGASVILDAYGQSIASIHSDGKTMTPTFEPDMADRIVELLNVAAGAELEATLHSAQPWGGAHDH